MRGGDDGREIGCDLKARRHASTAIDAIGILEGHAEGHDVWHGRDVTRDTTRDVTRDVTPYVAAGVCGGDGPADGGRGPDARGAAHSPGPARARPGAPARHSGDVIGDVIGM